MSDQIKITVEVNGQPGTLADVSLETLTGLRDKSVPRLPKPIEHGDYGYRNDDETDYRLFIEDDKLGLCAYDEKSAMRNRRIVDNEHKLYTITGNIFKDLQNA